MDCVTADLATALRARGMRVTPQRVMLHRALRELDRHVTAVELLEELGMVRRVQRAGTTLFDPRTDVHHHLICTSCGAIEDLDSDLDTARLERAAASHGFEPERIEAVVQGRCAGCQARSASARRRRDSVS